MPPLHVDHLILFLHHRLPLSTQLLLLLPLCTCILLAPTAKCWIIPLRLVGNLEVEMWVNASISLLTTLCVNMQNLLAICWSITPLLLSLQLLTNYYYLLYFSGIINK